jgi:hypothetical protein
MCRKMRQHFTDGASDAPFEGPMAHGAAQESRVHVQTHECAQAFVVVGYFFTRITVSPITMITDYAYTPTSAGLRVSAGIGRSWERAGA